MAAARVIDPVRVAVVGVGNFGRLHARTLAGLAEAELVGVIDANARAVDTLRQSLPDVRAWANVDEALRDPNVEAFVIATPTGSHVPIARKALKSKRAVLLEKPLSGDVASARSLAPLVARDSSNFMMGHIVLFAPEFRRLLSEAQRRGPVRYFHAVRHRPTSHVDDYPDDNPLRLTMVHDLYLALALTGGAEPQRMRGRLRRRRDGRVDLALAEVDWPDVWGSFTASFMTPPGMPRDGFDRFELFGDGWAARLSLNPQPIEVWSDRAEWPMALDIDDDPAAPSGWLAEELRHFCRVVRGTAPVPIGARYEDALKIQGWIEALEQSAASPS